MIIYQVRYNYEVFIIWSNLILLLLGIGIVLSFNVRLVNYQFMYNTKTIIEYETFSFIAFSFASVRSPRPSNSLLLTVTCLWSLWSRQTAFRHTGWTIKANPF